MTVSTSRTRDGLGYFTKGLGHKHIDGAAESIEHDGLGFESSRRAWQAKGYSTPATTKTTTSKLAKHSLLYFLIRIQYLKHLINSIAPLA